MIPHQRARGGQASLPALGRAGAADVGHRAAWRVALQHAAQVVGQGVVDARFNLAVKGQAHAVRHGLRIGFHAGRDVVAQHLGLPARKGRLARKVLPGCIARRPLPAPLAGNAARRHALEQPAHLHHVQAVGAPAGHHRRIKQDQALRQIGPLAGSQQAEEAAHRVADQMHLLAWCLLFDEPDELVTQVRPVAGDRVRRVMAEAFDGDDAQACRAPGFEHQPVGAGRKAVGVAEGNRGPHQTMRSPGLLILRMGSNFAPSWCSGCIASPPSQRGSSMLSKTSRRRWPQVVWIILK